MDCRTCSTNRSIRSRTRFRQNGATFRQSGSCGTVTIQSDDGDGGGCTSDADCPSGQVCEGGVCVDDGTDTGGGSGLPFPPLVLLVGAIGLGYVVMNR